MRVVCKHARIGRPSGHGGHTNCGHQVAVLFAVLLASAAPVGADIVVPDATGAAVRLAKPAQRIVSLAPHVAELLHAAGAGDRIVGAVEFSDYPPDMRAVVRVGSAAGLDLETIVGLRPDLIVGWQSGNPSQQIERLRSLGLAVYLTEPRRIQDIPVVIERLGEMAGTQASAARAAKAFRQRYADLRQRYANPHPVSVFYQVLDPVLLTVNGQHLISDAIRLCGGRNVFADLPLLVARVSVEAVLAANPDVIVASGEPAAWETWRARWRHWPHLDAVAAGRLHYLPPDAIHRPGPRILEGAEQLCALLDAPSRR